MESKMEFMYITRPMVVPWVSNNGLRVDMRTSRSITLRWETPQQMEILLPSSPDGMWSSRVSNAPPHLTIEPSHINTETVGTLYEIQMKRTGTDDWVTIYKGYSQKFEIGDLKPDTNLSFRMRRNEEKIWGTTVMASTDSPAPNADDLHSAVQCNHEDLLLRIIGSCKQTYLKKLLMSHDRSGHTPLMSAALNANEEIMALLIRIGARVNATALNTEKTALMLACFKGDLACVQMLDGAGADWELRDSSGCNAVHHAVNGENAKTFYYALKKRGFDAIEERDNGGWTPLLRAIIIGNSAEIVKILLKHGANPNARDNKNTKSCLLAAAMLGKAEFVVMLLEHKVDVTYKNGNGQSALEMALSKGYIEVANMLKRAMGRPVESIQESALSIQSSSRRVDTATRFANLGEVEPRPTPRFHEDTDTDSTYLLELEKKLSLMAIESAQNERELSDHRARIAHLKQSNAQMTELTKSVLPNGYTGPLPSRRRFNINLDPDVQDNIFFDIPDNITTTINTAHVNSNAFAQPENMVLTNRYGIPTSNNNENKYVEKSSQQTKMMHQRPVGPSHPAFQHHQHQSKMPKQGIKYPIIHLKSKQTKRPPQKELTRAFTNTKYDRPIHNRETMIPRMENYLTNPIKFYQPKPKEQTKVSKPKESLKPMYFNVNQPQQTKISHPGQPKKYQDSYAHARLTRQSNASHPIQPEKLNDYQSRAHQLEQSKISHPNQPEKPNNSQGHPHQPKDSNAYTYQFQETKGIHNHQSQKQEVVHTHVSDKMKAELNNTLLDPEPKSTLSKLFDLNGSGTDQSVQNILPFVLNEDDHNVVKEDNPGSGLKTSNISRPDPKTQNKN